MFLSPCLCKILFSKQFFGIINSWHIINFYLLGWLFLFYLPQKRKLIIILILLFSLLVLVSFIWIFSFLESNSIVWVTSNVISIFLSLIGFFTLLKKPSIALRELPVFYILTTILLYSSVTILVNLFFQYLVFDLNITKDGFRTITLILLISNSAKNFAFFYALVLISKGYPDTLKLKPIKTS